MYDEIKKDQNPLNLLSILAQCIKCLGFWITLLYTKDIMLASMVSLGGYLVDKHILTLPMKM